MSYRHGTSVEGGRTVQRTLKRRTILTPRGKKYTGCGYQKKRKECDQLRSEGEM
jgi:hypothetical protein